MGGMLAPGATIGILGGGQLGRMLALAAARLGYRCAIYCPETDSPAFDVAARHRCAAWDDMRALAGFAEEVDVVTFEFENVPLDTLLRLEKRVPVRPGPRSLACTQDRIEEKRFVAGLGIPVADFHAADDAPGLARALDALGGPAIAKTRRHGYDGKGQLRLAPGDDAAGAWRRLGGHPLAVERLVPFEREISILLARALDGRVAVWPAAENVHEGGILRRSAAPAVLPDKLARRAVDHATAIAGALGHVGVLAVEMFVVDGAPELLVNEIAPRVHNSGHWTMDGAWTCQFEQHVRAICGLPLGPCDARAPTRMENLIGEEIDAWPRLLAEPGARLHHYGKLEARPGRKMGHVNRVGRTS